MPLVRFVADPGGSLHGGDGLGVALFQEPGVCAGRRPFRFRSEPLFEGRQHPQGRSGPLEPKARRAGLVAGAGFPPKAAGRRPSLGSSRGSGRG